MVTIVRGTIPSEEFALHQTFVTHPELELEVERVVDTAEDRVMPLVWVRGPTDADVTETLAADDSVEAVERLASFDDECLYTMEWTDRIKLVLAILTNAEATIVEAYGTDDRWTLRVMYPTLEGLSETTAFCEEHDLAFDVEGVRELEGEPAGRYGLTTKQFEALVTAAERGLFEVPRETTLEELAAEFDVTHQALSERIRRGTGALVEDALLVGARER